MTIGLHQGSTLSSYIFAPIMDKYIAQTQEEVPSCMLFVNDIVLVEGSKDGVNGVRLFRIKGL